MFGRWFKSRQTQPESLPGLPAGQRVYAIGDIHGRLDLLDTLLAMVDEDDRVRPHAELTLIFLGDLVDRGPDSAAVIDRLIELKRILPQTRFLLGNHEEVMLLTLGGDRESLKLFDRIGGRETMLSYGVTEQVLAEAGFKELAEIFPPLVPQAHIDFLNSFEDVIVMGDYAFVHAGVQPGRALDQQKKSDLRWIRRGFLDFDGTLDKVIVHGHTIAHDVEWMPHRIGIDTGAYMSGRLTALGLEGSERWLIQTDGAALAA